MLSFHKDVTSKQQESNEEIEVLTSEVSKARISNSNAFLGFEISSPVTPWSLRQPRLDWMMEWVS